MHPDTKKALERIKSGEADANPPTDPRDADAPERRERPWSRFASAEVVHAIKIARFEPAGDGAVLHFDAVNHGPNTPGGEDVWTKYEPVRVGADFLKKFNPRTGGYLIRSDGGGMFFLEESAFLARFKQSGA